MFNAALRSRGALVGSSLVAAVAAVSQGSTATTAHNDGAPDNNRRGEGKFYPYGM